MTSTTLSLSAFSHPASASTNTRGDAASASGQQPVILKFDLPVQHSDALKDHTDFDALMAELDAAPEHAAGFAEARAWVADSFYGEDGDTIRTLRLRLGMTQNDLAASLDTSQPQIAKIESGRQDPVMSTCRKLAKALGVSLDVVGEALERQAHLNQMKAEK
ncbi:anaerobic benzoate catabolism transcriptional regulator [compost metagenome]|jgi:DNA-binding XRE family transcriptional regulator